MEDIRALLARSTTVPETKRKATNYSVIHWNGDSVLNSNGNFIGDVPLLQADARFHVAPPPRGRGWDGLSYHYGIGRAGMEYQCRNWDAKLAHSGNTLMNNEAFSVLVITGDGDPISSRQYAALHRRLVAIGIDRRYWLGHQEAPRSTSCPGALLMRWIGEKRNEVRQQVSNVRILYNANVRDEPSVLSALVGNYPAGTANLSGYWRLGKPVRGDCLWLEISGDRYIHASALDTRSYTKVW